MTVSEWPEIKNILIVANSGRMLAQCAKHAGYSSIVIDCFADVDTQVLAKQCFKVSSLALESIKTAFSTLTKQYTITHAVYGSGFECHQSSLAFLSQQLIILGNAPEIFSAIQNKSFFFSKLNQLQIPYPETSFFFPKHGDDWLLKPMYGEGGLGIRKYRAESEVISPSCYWQKYIPGIPMSVLFIVDGTRYTMLGFHKQQFVRVGDQEFVFSGVMTQPDINNEIRHKLTAWVKNIVNTFVLKGINSLDFIAGDDGQLYVLEVNARPSASMQLYDGNLLTLHINGFLQKKQEMDIGLIGYRAYNTIFAESDVAIKDNIKWPVWVADIPKSNSFIHTGMPICSIIANGKNEQQVSENVLLKQHIISKLLR